MPSPVSPYGIWNARPIGDTSVGNAGAAGGLGKQDFFNLLAAQLRFQNPLEPVNNSEFMAQTAQFNTLEQLQQMNGMLEAALGMNSLSQASDLIGRYVTAVNGDETIVEGTVTEVTMHEGQPMLLVDGTVVPLQNVVIVGAPPSEPPGDPPADDSPLPEA
jgi:flagellar basal-body rod modification protein FlgD